MKANAKKLLALILAMVMCLSLAAPAFAEYDKTSKTWTNVASSTDLFATDTNLGTIVYKAKKTFATRIEVEDGNKGIYKVYGFKKDTPYTVTDVHNDAITEDLIVAGNVTDATQPTGVTVERTAGGLIGQAKNTTYKVSYSGATTSVEATATVGNEAGTKAVQDVTEWKDLAEGQTVTIANAGGTGSTVYLVSGKVYQEPQFNGLYKPYFQLFKADKAANSFKTTEAPLYFVGVAGSELKTAADFDKALAVAEQCNYYGEKSGVTNAGENVNVSGAALPTTVAPTVTKVYAFKAIEASKDLTVAGGDKVTAKFATDTDLTTGSFQVSIQVTATTSVEGTITGTTTTYVTDVDEAKKILADKWADGNNAKLESVEAGSGNFVTVKVSKNVTADPVEEKDSLYALNVASFSYKTAFVNTPVLFNVSKDGWYKGTTDKGANATAIAANYEALGPVLVRKSEVDDQKFEVRSYIEDDGTYYVFKDVETMKKNIKAKKCESAKTVNYVQVVVNPWNGTKENKLVTVVTNKSVYDSNKAFKQNVVGHVEMASRWKDEAYNTPSADFVKKGTFEVEAAEHGKNKGTSITKVVTTEPTCQKPGERTISTICNDCKKVVETKTEEIPAITDPVEKKDPNDYTNYAFAQKGTTSHYVAKQETKTTADPATGMITATTTYTCNFGVVHEELTHVETAKKADLQFSGRWDSLTVDKFSAFDLWNMGEDDRIKSGLIKGVTVADTDVELTNFPINRNVDAGKFFTWTTVNGFGADAKGHSDFVKDEDGNYYSYKALERGVDVYATADGLATTKYYAAKLSVKNIKVPATSCEDASCEVVVDVYEVSKKEAVIGNAYSKDACVALINNADKLEKNLKDKKITLVKSLSETVTIPGYGHKFFNDDGEATELCVRCGTKRESETPVANVIDPANVVVKDLTWTGKLAQPKVTVKDADGFALIKGTDYVVSEIDAIDVGEYSITIKGLNEYAGNKFTKTFKINKAKATLKKKSAPKTLTANKKKAVTGQIKMTVKGGKVAKYKVTKKVAGVSVNKSGKITVKKNNKKAGTLKVKVTMKADKNHTAAKAVTVKVAIKAAKK